MSLRCKFVVLCFSDEVFTPEAFANFSPALERSDYAGKLWCFDLNTPKVLANAFGVIKHPRCCFQGRNPGLELANTFGVVASHLELANQPLGCDSAALSLCD
jgi:hypothetical protein